MSRSLSWTSTNIEVYTVFRILGLFYRSVVLVSRDVDDDADGNADDDGATGGSTVYGDYVRDTRVPLARRAMGLWQGSWRR